MYNERSNGRSKSRNSRMANSGGSVDRNRSNSHRIRRPIPLRPVNPVNELHFYEEPVENFYPARPPMARPPYFNAQNDMPGLGEEEYHEYNGRRQGAYGGQPGAAGACCAEAAYGAGAASAAGCACGPEAACAGAVASSSQCACTGIIVCGEAAACGEGPVCASGAAGAEGDENGEGAAYAEGAGCAEGAPYAIGAGQGGAGAAAADLAEVEEEGAVGGAEAGAEGMARAVSPARYGGGNYARQIRFPANAYGVVAILPPPQRFCVRCHVPLAHMNVRVNFCEGCNIPIHRSGNPLRDYHHMRNPMRHHRLREQNPLRDNQPSPPEHNVALGDLVIPPRGQEYYPPRYYQNRVIVYGEPCYCPLPNLMVDFGIDYEIPPPDVMLRRCIHNVLSAVCNTCVPGCFIRPY